MASHVTFTVGLSEISAAIVAGSLPELIVGGVIIVGGLWLAKMLVEMYVKLTGESAIMREHGDRGHYVKPA